MKYFLRIALDASMKSMARSHPGPPSSQRLCRFHLPAIAAQDGVKKVHIRSQHDSYAENDKPNK